MKKLLLIATGGTIASRHTDTGLSPQIPESELLAYVPEAKSFCEADCVQPFSLDSTNVHSEHWLKLSMLIEENYEKYDGFVICHGTDTMAYTAAALSYLIRNSRKPVVITGSQRPIDLSITDARSNLLDSLRFASDDRAHDVVIVFGGLAIAGTRAKKERTRSYNAFSSINFPPIAVLHDERVVFYIDDKEKVQGEAVFAHSMNPKVFLYKLIPGSDGSILELIADKYDAVIIESFGVGGIPQYGDDRFHTAVRKWIESGRLVVMSTQVTFEGSDMSAYQVGHVMKNTYRLPESYDMTPEAAIAKSMWILGQTKDKEQFEKLFYTPVNHDLLFEP